jgi:exonuclease SbcC
MIKSLRLKQFRSHEDSCLEFSPGINVILGRSGCGKTNILRALIWLATNRPRGLAFRSRFAKKGLPTEVEAAVSPTSTPNGKQLVTNSESISLTLRKSTKGMAVYSVGNTELTGFGSSVPEEVVELLDLNPELNIREQLDAPFLITSSPGEVAGVINRVTKLENVDKWVSQLTTRVNSTKKKKK